jgi:glycosyltransferase involved in cell wall biosynthesis
MTGSLGRPEVRRQMWEANALVMPSDFETFGVVLIEAMSTGLPVIATRCGGPEEIVNGEAGSLVDCSDGKGLLQTMSDFLTRTFEPVQIRNDATRRFGYSAVADRLCSVYDSVAAQRREVA